LQSLTYNMAEKQLA